MTDFLKLNEQLNPTPVEQPAAGDQPAVDQADQQTDWRKRYYEERNLRLSLQRQLADLRNPPRNSLELQRDLESVERFLASMSLSEGAVTCANLYNEAFYLRDGDTTFLRRLSELLVSRYKTSYALIEKQYAFWQKRATM